MQKLQLTGQSIVNTAIINMRRNAGEDDIKLKA